ncbi:MAG TPA: penicillin-insensitive murein endopeptidase, partial [Nannocystaceae bacterium]|nr:penicillin-insensitive murein endopeptidase [Nannocystaceae bacterium]
NGMSTETMRLKKGTRLKLRARRSPPPRERIEYVVAEGDDWWSVARAHGADVHDLQAYNWPHRDKMVPGKTIVVWSDPVVRGWIAQDNADQLGVSDGGAGVGSPDAGWLIGGARIPEGEGYVLHQPAWSYGTTHAVRELVRALAAYHEAGGPLVELGAMSKLRGGEIGDHRSHQTGRDVDIGLPRRVGLSRMIPLTNRRIDWIGVWTLIEVLAAADVDVVWLHYEQQKRVHEAALKAGVPRERVAKLLQYPMGRASRALVHHAEGHDLHLHVRFGCGPCEPECVDARNPELASP